MHEQPSSPAEHRPVQVQECGLKVPCKGPMTCIAGKESALCDERNIDKLCECATPTSAEVPTPTTGGTPTTGDKP